MTVVASTTFAAERKDDVTIHKEKAPKCKGGKHGDCIVEVCGIKYEDANGNGVQDNGEVGLPDWRIVIEANQTSYLVVTDDDGRFCRSVPIDVSADARVYEMQQDGWEQTQPADLDGYSLTLSDQVSYWFRFGNHRLETEVCGLKYLDMDEDGIFEEADGEIGLSGWSINLYLLDEDGVPTAIYTEITDDDGNYCFTASEYDLPADVTAIVGEQWQLEYDQTGPDHAPGTYSVVLQEEKQFLGNNFGNNNGVPFCAIDTVLVVDRTGSMGSGGLFPAAMTAVNMFIAAAAQDGIDQNPNNPLWHQVGVASFNTQGTLDNPLTWDLANLVPTVSAPDGSTAIETGLNVGIAHLSDFNFRNPNAQPVIILLSDGGNTNAASDTWTANAATAATAAGIRLVTIAYGTGAPSTLLQSITPNPGDFYQAGAVNIDQILANIVSTLCTGDVSGQKFHDQNANGLWDSNEPPLEGWVFTLLDSAGIPVDSAVSGPDGTYTFEDVAIGSYTIVETGQPDWFQTFPPDGAGHQVVVTPGDNLTGFDFGNTECPTCGEISGIKWNDLNGNGVQDAGEPPLAGFNFILVDSNGESAGFATSGSDGSFTFPDLSADIYTIIELAQPNWVQTFPADGMPHVVSLEAGESITGVDFGNQECACGTISGYKWEDQNNNGVWDSGEPVLDGFTFLLLDANNNLVEMVTSNANGYYEFSDLPPGTYIVSEQAMGGWALTSPQTGSHTITIGFGEHSMDNNFGNYRCGDDQCGSGAVLVPTIKGLEKLMPGSKGHMTVSIKNEGEATRGTPSVVLPLATGFQAIERSWADNGWKCTASEASVTCVYSDVIERSAETQVSIPMMATREAQSTMLCAYAGAVNDLHPQDNFACTLVNFGDTRK